jgi:hypothetical protein
MRKSFVLAALAAVLLTGCESKKETCAKLEAGMIQSGEANQRLGLNLVGDYHEKVWTFCRKL